MKRDKLDEDFDEQPAIRHVILIDSDKAQFEGSQLRLVKFTEEDPNTETQVLDNQPTWKRTATAATALVSSQVLYHPMTMKCQIEKPQLKCYRVFFRRANR